MTNAMIIFIESQKLAEAGKITYTGRVFKGVNPLGEEVEFKETEPIHTFKTWKDRGYRVRKGEHAVAQFPIWMYSPKKEEVEAEDGTIQEIDKSKMYMKKASFFSASQVEVQA